MDDISENSSFSELTSVSSQSGYICSDISNYEGELGKTSNEQMDTTCKSSAISDLITKSSQNDILPYEGENGTALNLLTDIPCKNSPSGEINIKSGETSDIREAISNCTEVIGATSNLFMDTTCMISPSLESVSKSNHSGLICPDISKFQKKEFISKSEEVIGTSPDIKNSSEGNETFSKSGKRRNRNSVARQQIKRRKSYTKTNSHKRKNFRRIGPRSNIRRSAINKQKRYNRSRLKCKSFEYRAIRLPSKNVNIIFINDSWQIKNGLCISWQPKK